MELSPIADVARRNNVTERGNPIGQPILFAHGFGCSQATWRRVAPHFEADYRVVLFDHVGAGGSDLSAYDRAKYDSLDGYAEDVVDIVEALDLRDVIFVGHSVSAMIGALAANRAASRFATLVLISPSPRYTNDGDYIGGFEQADIDALLDTLDANYLGWSAVVAPMMMAHPDRPELGEDLVESFCSIDPVIARQFARVTFLSDNRDDLALVSVPTIIIQSSDDAIAPLEVGQYVQRAIVGSRLQVMPTTGHVSILSDPDAVVAEVLRALR